MGNDDENVTVTMELGFDSFCSDMDGSLVDDTTCDLLWQYNIVNAS